MIIDKITAPKVMNELCDHLTRHKDVYDPRSEKMSKTLYGETGVNGLAGTLAAQKLTIDGAFAAQNVTIRGIDKRLEKMEERINWGVLLILGIFLTSLAKLVIK